jgi:preprotein translocase subunit SecG
MFAALQLVFQILLAIVAVFLILLVLVQRGRGGGLAGALGGMGGSSAFGAKAGDIFTRITIGAAAVWIVLCIAAAKFGPATAGSRLDLGTDPPVSTGPALTPAVKEVTEKAATEGEPKTDASATEEKPAAETPDTESAPPIETPSTEVPASESVTPAAEATTPAADEAKTE